MDNFFINSIRKTMRHLLVYTLFLDFLCIEFEIIKDRKDVAGVKFFDMIKY
jgi:hypothetical protein